MAIPSTNLQLCAKSLASIDTVMLSFSSKMDNLIAAVEKIKIGGGGGKKGGGGGGGADADAIDIAKTASTKRLAQAKAVADLEFSKAKAAHEFALKNAKLRSQRNGSLDASVYAQELAAASALGKARYGAAKKAANLALSGAYAANSAQLAGAGASAKVMRNFHNKAQNQDIANIKNNASVFQSQDVKSKNIKMALDDQISQSEIAQKKKIEAAKVKAQAAGRKADEKYNENARKDAVDAAKSLAHALLNGAKITGEAAFVAAKRTAKEELADAKEFAKSNTSLTKQERLARIDAARTAGNVALDAAARVANDALRNASDQAQDAVRNAGASSKEIRSLNRKIYDTEAGYNAKVYESSLANAESVGNAKRSINAQIQREEAAKAKKLADAASKGSRGSRGGGGGGGPKDKSKDFTGAKSFDPRAFFDSLRGGLISGIVGAATQGFAVFQKTRQNVSEARGGRGAPGGGAAAAMGPIVGVMGVATAAMGALTGGFSILIEMVGKFVGALDPAIMEQLNLAFSDLSAVVGIGLRPIITAATVIIRSFADALVPVMRKLEPIITKLASVMISIAIPIIVAWADQLEMLMPVFNALVPIVAILGELFSGVLMVVIPLFKVLAGVCLILVGVFNAVVAAVHGFAAGILWAVTGLLKIIPGQSARAAAAQKQAEAAGASSAAALSNAGNNIADGGKMIGTAFTSTEKEVKGGESRGAAAKGASYSGVADLGKNMMQAAFGSSTQSVENKQLEQQKQAAGELGIIRGLLLNWKQPKDAAAGVRN